MLEINKIYNSKAEIFLKKLNNNFIDLTITSPPYDELREYDGFSWDIDIIVPELFRTTKDGGVCVWVVNDQVIDGSETGSSFRQALKFIDFGWKLHDTMIYEKNGAVYPANEKSNRYSQVFEYMFIFSKGKPKTTNLIKDSRNRWGGYKSFGTNSERQVNGEIKKRDKIIIGEYGYRSNIWRINNGYRYSSKDECAYEHPAIFPESLVRDHVITWSNEGDLICDIFNGSGTTTKVSFILKRNFIACDESLKYCELANKRLELHKNNFFS